MRKHFDNISSQYDMWKRKNDYYYSQLKRLFSSIIPPGKKVLEIGCGTGDVLNSVSPKEGLGVDISPKMVKIAKTKYPQLSFKVSEAEQLELKEKYDYVIMSDILEHLIDVWKVLKNLKKVIKPDGRVVISFINPLWEPLLILGEKLRMKMPEGPHNRLYSEDIINLLELNDFEIKEKGYRLFIPKKIPWFSNFLNRYVPHLPLIKNLCFVQYLVVTPKEGKQEKRSFSCSVIIPCHNEEESYRYPMQNKGYFKERLQKDANG